MRCTICDTLLSDSEAVAKDSKGEFLDSCNICIEIIRVLIDDYEGKSEQTPPQSLASVTRIY